MVVQVSEIEFAAKQLAEALNHVPNQIERLETEIQLCDQETQDLLHLIEFSNCHASDGYKLYKDLQITRRKRREFKEELEALKLFDERMKKQRPMNQQMSVLNYDIEKQKDKRANRNYTPRVRSDLIERFNKCNARRRAENGE